jgi:hypothetical protein
LYDLSLSWCRFSRHTIHSVDFRGSRIHMLQVNSRSRKKPFSNQNIFKTLAIYTKVCLDVLPSTFTYLRRKRLPVLAVIRKARLAYHSSLVARLP